ncbi:YgcG family protein [Phenylobacterium sp.]|uniref:TPM domain-containing protein n=1 Tax=Phenylobacterium sp. TaxID=1871053 RepID=UPI00356428EF
MTNAPRALFRRGGGLLVAVLAVFAIAGAAFAATGPKFPALSGRVVDDAHMLSPATVEKLDGELAGLEAQTGHQVVVATVPDLQGYEIEDYGYQLGRTWQLGKKGVNDGAILLVAPKEHKVRIEVGYGLEPVLTDALTSVILQEKVLPQFKQGYMEQGVVDGAEALVAQIGLPDDQAKANAAQAAAKPRVQAHDRSLGPHIPVLFIIFILFWIVSGLLRAGGRRGGMGGLWWLPFLFMGGGRGGGRGGGWGGGGGGFGGGGGGGFSGGGGSFGGGGSSGSW